jgi:hypothetical protein
MTREQVRAALVTAPRGAEIALVSTLIGEVLNEPLDGILAVATTIRNRVEADIWTDRKPDWWGEGYVGVCLKGWQFSCWWQKNANANRVYAVAAALLQDQEQTSIPASRFAAIAWVAKQVMAGRVPDLSGGADHYLTTTLLRKKPPVWAKTKPSIVRAGAHSFFRLETW